MFLIIGQYNHAKDFIKDKGLNPKYCRIVSRPDQLRGLDRGLPAVLVHMDYEFSDRTVLMEMIYNREIVLLNCE